MHPARLARGALAAALFLAAVALECDLYASLCGSPLQLDGAAMARMLQSALGSAGGP